MGDTIRPIGGGEDTAAVKERLTELRTAAKTLIEENHEIVRTAKTEEVDGPEGTKVPATYIDAERKERFDENLKKVKEELQPEIKRIEEMLELTEWGSQPAGSSVAVAANAAQAAALAEGPVRKSLGDLLIGSEEWAAFKDSSAVPRSMELGMKSLQRKDVYTDLPEGTPGSFGRVQRDPLVPMPQRSFRVRDLFPVIRTDARTIEFFRVTGFNNAASVVPERSGSAFALKPHSNLSIEGLQAPARRIAHWEVAHRDVLDDEPQLRGIIDNELLYGLTLTEDYQILQGTGGGEDLLGILNTPGIQSYPNPGGDEGAPMIALRHAVTLAFLANYEATGIVLHPLNWEQVETARDTEGRFLTFAFPGEGATPKLWRLPVVVTPAIPENTGLVGSFGLGAALYDREVSNIRVAEQHEDYFVRNAVVILAEERLALATKRPESFVKVTALDDVS